MHCDFPSMILEIYKIYFGLTCSCTNLLVKPVIDFLIETDCLHNKRLTTIQVWYGLLFMDDNTITGYKWF